MQDLKFFIELVLHYTLLFNKSFASAKTLFSKLNKLLTKISFVFCDIVKFDGSKCHRYGSGTFDVCAFYSRFCVFYNNQFLNNEG